jgi:hypothetical protein
MCEGENDLFDRAELFVNRSRYINELRKNSEKIEQTGLGIIKELEAQTGFPAQLMRNKVHTVLSQIRETLERDKEKWEDRVSKKERRAKNRSDRTWTRDALEEASFQANMTCGG